ncbi:MAG TPA: alanine--tRNA ligase [Clostridiales bacterium]|nr:alanine--tRNA ligase [Clostridiales bacterium]
MEKLSLNELRTKFLNFFESKDHLILPSFSLVPQNDKSLLLINAGMAPLKPYFTGQEIPPKRRIATCQKCIRTPDIENVGKTARHATFFEMLGNFSFGDYFKREAIQWAWEFVTEELNLPIERLWVTIYLDDDEAFEIWSREIGLSEERIVRMGKEDNFWEIGVGPCGPCSEIYYDRGIEKGCGKPDCGVGCDCDRFVEFWNLVFTQFNKDENGHYTELAHPNIDTGMGLERIAAIMQDVDSIFEVDTLKHIIDAVGVMADVEYGKDEKKDISLRVITDHIRATTFMISDGILPSNEGRGYVLRRILRRAARHGKLLGIEENFLKELAEVVISESHSAYPELLERKDYILNIIEIEEKRFNDTLEQGLNILDKYIHELEETNECILDGRKAFMLYDTYGFPLELTKEILEEHNLKVDEEGFSTQMEMQREKARLSREETNYMGTDDSIVNLIDTSVKTDFVGYDTLKTSSNILAIIKGDELVELARENDEVFIILDKTPFYPESGGQIGDVGIIKDNKGNEIYISDTKKISDSKIIHVGKVIKGELSVGDSVKAVVDKNKRMAIARNHTCTHLLHRALKEILGNHVEQSGSLVTADRLRFDFSHFSPLTKEEILQIEELVNEKIFEAIDVQVIETTIDEAKKMGAVALFGEKYKNIVRVIKIGNFSMELCGGTHLKNTSQIGLFKIMSETGVAAGIRRIEAVTGLNVYNYINHLEDILSQVSEKLKVNVDDIPLKVISLLDELTSARRDLELIQKDIALKAIDDIIEKRQLVDGIPYIAAFVKGQDMKNLRNMADILLDKIKTGVIVLASDYNNKVSLVAAATKDVIKKGIHSGNLIREVAKKVDGGGGGRPDMAQAGGKDISKINEALDSVKDLILNQINK